MTIMLDGVPESHPLETGDTSDEKLDDLLLTQAFHRQAEVSLLVSGIAKRLYRARTVWIGGQALEWHELTPRQRYGYFTEAERLVKEEQ